MTITPQTNTMTISNNHTLSHFLVRQLLSLHLLLHMPSLLRHLRLARNVLVQQHVLLVHLVGLGKTRNALYSSLLLSSPTWSNRNILLHQGLLHIVSHSHSNLIRNVRRRDEKQRHVVAVGPRRVEIPVQPVVAQRHLAVEVKVQPLQRSPTRHYLARPRNPYDAS